MFKNLLVRSIHEASRGTSLSKNRSLRLSKKKIHSALRKALQKWQGVCFAIGWTFLYGDVIEGICNKI